MANKSKGHQQVQAPAVVAAAALPSADHPICQYLSLEQIQALQENGIIRDANIFTAFVSLKGETTPTAATSGLVKGAVAGLFARVQEHNRKSARLTVLTYFLIGTVLEEMSSKMPRKADYMIWVRESFGRQHHLEALRQARKLARLGKDILKLAHLGKNRCLELYYLIKQVIDDEPENQRDSVKEVLTEIAEKYWPQDLANQSSLEPEDATDIRLTLDTILTIYRLKLNGVDETIFTFDQAKMIAAFRGLAIEATQAIGIAKYLAGFDTLDKKKAAFDGYVMDRMTFPHDDTVRPMSLRQLLASFALWRQRRGNQITEESLGSQYLDLRHNADTQRAVKEAYQTIKALARIGGFTLQG
jgi:hypothetical protein